MKTLILATMIAVLFSTGIAFAQDSGSANVATDSESTFYRSLLDDGIKHGFPGYILGVKHKEKPTWMGAAGKSDIERNIDMRSNDRFHIASITKIFTATAVLQLIDQGKLFLDTKVTSLLDKKLLNRFRLLMKLRLHNCSTTRVEFTDLIMTKNISRLLLDPVSKTT